MELQLSPLERLSYPLVEGYIKNLEEELTDLVELGSKEDAQEESELTTTVFKVKVVDPVQSKVQLAIDFIRQTLLPTSKVFDVNEIEQISQKKLHTVGNDIKERAQKLPALRRKIKSFVLDPFNTKYGKWFIIFSLIIGVTDGTLAYTGFRYGSYTVLLALISAFAICCAIAISHLFYAGWIQHAATYRQKFVRIVVVLTVAFAFFAWIGNLRAEAVNSAVSIAVEDSDVLVSTLPHLNGWAITFLSLVLFATVLFLSLRFWKSKEERLEEQEHKRLKAELYQLEAEINALEREQEAIKSNVVIQKREARACVNYANTAIERCKNIGANAVIRYKKAYAQYHNNIVPDFFDASFGMTYDESLHFFKPSKTERA